MNWFRDKDGFLKDWILGTAGCLGSMAFILAAVAFIAICIKLFLFIVTM